MSDHENILSFRRLDGLTSNATDSGGSPDESKRIAADHDPDEERRVLPLVNLSGPQPFTWLDLRDKQPSSPVQIRLGKSRLPKCEANPLASGAIVVLDRTIDEPVEIVVAGQVIGFGRLVVAHGKLAVQVCQVKRSGREKTA